MLSAVHAGAASSAVRMLLHLQSVGLRSVCMTDGADLGVALHMLPQPAPQRVEDGLRRVAIHHHLHIASMLMP